MYEKITYIMIRNICVNMQLIDSYCSLKRIQKRSSWKLSRCPHADRSLAPPRSSRPQSQAQVLRNQHQSLHLQNTSVFLQSSTHSHHTNELFLKMWPVSSITLNEEKKNSIRKKMSERRFDYRSAMSPTKYRRCVIDRPVQCRYVLITAREFVKCSTHSRKKMF